MTYDLIIRPEAENDIREAFSWYEAKRNGLGYEFLLNPELTVKKIKNIK